MGGFPPRGTPVPTIVHKLNHTGRSIDIFKIDCEGCEWNTYKSWFGSGVYIQIQIELHGVNSQTHAFFKFLFDLGYVIFHKESNTLGCSGSCIESSLLRLTPDFSRAAAGVRPPSLAQSPACATAIAAA